MAGGWCDFELDKAHRSSRFCWFHEDGRHAGLGDIKDLGINDALRVFKTTARWALVPLSAVRGGRVLKAHDLITSPAFIVIKTANEFKDKTTEINQLWQTDFTYIKVLGWGWFYLSTVLDDYSRYIVSWKLCTNMRTEDVTDTLDLALQASGCDQVHVVHKPRLLSDNGSSYVSGDLAEWLQDKGMKHSRGAPYHPQTQGKIERWHQTLKNRILLENYFLPGDLEAQIEAFVDHYNHLRYHESINNVTPADVYFGRDKAILKQRERIKPFTTRATHNTIVFSNHHIPFVSAETERRWWVPSYREYDLGEDVSKEDNQAFHAEGNRLIRAAMPLGKNGDQRQLRDVLCWLKLVADLTPVTFFTKAPKSEGFMDLVDLGVEGAQDNLLAWLIGLDSTDAFSLAQVVKTASVPQSELVKLLSKYGFRDCQMKREGNRKVWTKSPIGVGPKHLVEYAP